MFEYVLSEYMRKYLQDKKRAFTDFEKATLIWNTPLHSFEEKINALSELAALTTDYELKEQIVRIIETGEYAVVDSGEKHWNVYMENTDENPSFYDFSDIQTIVFVLKEDGHWSHEHVNPMYLEPEIPLIQEKNDKANTHREALIALSQYFQDKSKENSVKAVEASRKYADICARINWSKILYETDGVEKLIF